MKTLLKKLSSFNITLFGLIGYLVIIFWGTLAQVNHGIYYTQKVFFGSYFIWSDIGTFQIPIFPGGFLLGLILSVNLVAAIITRKLYTTKKLGLCLIHSGLLVLLIGAAVTQIFSIESQLAIDEGQTKNFSEASRDVELVVINRSHNDYDNVVAIPGALLKQTEAFTHSDIPFSIKVLVHFENAYVSMEKSTHAQYTFPKITQGIGAAMSITPLPEVTQEDLVNMPAVIVECFNGDKSLGTWLLGSTLGAPQTIEIDGQKLEIYLRYTRYYTDYKITLKDFKFDRYLGTNIPKNFSSLIHLSDLTLNEEREILIYMNNPLRYKGKTYFQSSFGKDEKMSVFQVVENPGWLFPYASCLLISLGLLWHFLLSLKRFTKRSAK
jgi:hypothetical protein